jgi:hypothetical protein
MTFAGYQLSPSAASGTITGPSRAGGRRRRDFDVLGPVTK